MDSRLTAGTFRIGFGVVLGERGRLTLRSPSCKVEFVLQLIAFFFQKLPIMPQWLNLMFEPFWFTSSFSFSSFLIFSLSPRPGTLIQLNIPGWRRFDQKKGALTRSIITIKDWLVNRPYVEKRHALLKTEAAPVYLKKPRPVAGLLHAVFLALMLDALIERTLHRGMQRYGIERLPILPEERESKTPTTARLLEIFSDVTWYDFEKEGEATTFPIELSP